MLILASTIFGLAVILWFIDMMIDNAGVDLSVPVRVLIVMSALLIGLNLCIHSG
jgi:hypothetical protein